MAKFPVSFFLRWWWRMPPRTPYISILHTHGITISFYDSFPYDEAMKPSCCKWRRRSWSWFCAQGNRHCLDACRLTTRAPTCQPATGQWAWAAEPPAAAAAAASTGWVLIAQAFRIGPGKAAAHGIQQPLETGVHETSLLLLERIKQKWRKKGLICLPPAFDCNPALLTVAFPGCHESWRVPDW
jgi:hypothetical protein